MRKMTALPWRSTRRQANRLIIALSVATLLIRLIDPSVSRVSFIIQSLIWMTFLFYATLYSSKAYNSHPFWHLHRAEWVIICLWNPLTFALHADTPALDTFHRVVEHVALIFQFSGLVAHVWIVGRAFRKQWGQHPLFCALLCIFSIVGLTSTLLMEYEPTTFTNWPVTLWFCVETISTVGYGDVVPQGISARLLSFALIVFGGGVHAIVLALVGQMLLDLVEWRHPIERKRDRRKPARPSDSEMLITLHAKLDELQSQMETLQHQLEQTQKNRVPED